MKKYTLPLIASAVAIAITVTMDFTGYSAFSAFPLIVITAVFWPIMRLSKEEMGLKFGSARPYGYALLYPLVVLGAAVLISWLVEGIQFDQANQDKHMINLLAGVLIGPLMVLLTEEGFFRGLLWGAFRKAGLSENRTLFVTTLLFTLWHISAVTSGTDYGLPLTQVPVYLVNATLLGLIWGLLRQISGSAIVPSVSHAVWNACAYGFFAFGEKVGMLGIENTFLLGPEVGYMGILLNGLFFIWLWKKATTKNKNS